MKLSTRARYGTRVFIDLAINRDKIPLGTLAKRQHVSHSYLQHLIAPLTKAGIISSTRGFDGGLRISHPLEEVKLSQVVQLLEGDSLISNCVENPETCIRANECRTRMIWARMERAIIDTLDSIDLNKLIKNRIDNDLYQYPNIECDKYKYDIKRR